MCIILIEILLENRGESINLISMSVKKRKSKHYYKVEKIIKTMPNFKSTNDYIYFELTTIEDFWKNRQEIELLYDKLIKWKDTKIEILGKENVLKYKIFYRELENYVEKKYDFLPSLEFTIEDDLPMKYVFYGCWTCFLVFMEDLDSSKYYFCDCQKDAIECSIKYFDNARLDFPSFVFQDYYQSKNKETFFENKFRKNLCFTCNNSSSTRTFCSRMYETRFMQDYGWYIYSRCYSKKIDPHNDKIILRKIENEVREEYGYHKIGEKWISETKMYNLIKEIFPEEEIIFHYRSEWLSYLEIDVYLPKLKMGFEYQGRQHFEPVDFFGGEDKFKIQQSNDIKKERICKENNVKLFKVNYDDPLNKKFIKRLIAPS
ncbi:MAG: hypothetical protein ACTJHC_02650 [Vagococcus sp.]